MLIDLRRLKKDSSRVSRQPTNIPMTGIPVPANEGKRTWKNRLWLGAVALVVLSSISILLLRSHSARLNPNRTSVTIRIPFRVTGIASVSGDGNWFSFPAKDENGKWDVYLMNTAGNRPTRITDQGAFHMESAALSPDASEIAYDCMDSPNSYHKVKIVSSQGGGSRTIADIGIGPQWTPDGQRIGYRRFFSAARNSGKAEIWSTRPDGTDTRLEYTDTVSAPGPETFCWSPDGRSIGWVRNFPQKYGEVMVRDLETGRERQITFDRKTVDEVTWATNDDILFTSNKSGQSNLWIIPAAGGEATQATAGGISTTGARISRDNKTLVYAQGANIDHLWISALDGSSARQISFDDVRTLEARFSPDGKHVARIIADVDFLNRESHLYVMDHDGKNQRQLTSGSESVFASCWSPDGKWLAYASAPLGMSNDSITVYLIQPFNPGPPRELCKGIGLWWLDDESLVVFYKMKSLLYSVRGSTATQVYHDSTAVFHFTDAKELVYFDHRKGRAGWWVVSIDSLRRQKGGPRKFATGADFSPTDDWRFLIYKRAEGNTLWRLWTSTWKEEKIGEGLPGQARLWHVNSDGKEILWDKSDSRSQLVIVKNLFE